MLNKRLIIIAAILLSVTTGGVAYYISQSLSDETADEHGHGGEAGEEHEHESAEDARGDSHGHEESEADQTHISEAALKKLNVQILNAGPASIAESIRATGRVILNQNKAADVKARFAGPIRSVEAQPGQSVRQGQILATVESNDSLQIYPLRSPLSGTVISREARVGDTAGDAPLFVVADLSELWAEIFVYTGDGSRIEAGQKAMVQALGDEGKRVGIISVLLPAAEATSQSLIAHATIANEDGHWRPGMNIRAEIIVNERQVPVSVRTQAIQRMEGKLIVFVRQGDGSFRAQPVQTGSSDGDWTEIRSGLQAGQAYAGANSFVIKADIGKAGAEHEH